MQISSVNMEPRKNLDLRTGDTVRVMQKIQEKDKTRLQPFEGMVIAMKHGKEAGATFTVRRSTGGFGVEKIYPLYSPMIDSIEVTKRSKVRKSKLYHIRETALKQIGKRMKMMFVNIKEEKEEPKPEPTETTEETQTETPAENPEVKKEAPTESETSASEESEEVKEEKKEV